VATPHELDSSLNESFDSAQLEEEFNLLGLESANQLDKAPPSKRRKVHFEIELLEQIIGKLYSLLGSQNATDLAGLGQLTE
jgi:serine/threonine-protein kinase ATR